MTRNSSKKSSAASESFHQTSRNCFAMNHASQMFNRSRQKTWCHWLPASPKWHNRFSRWSSDACSWARHTDPPASRFTRCRFCSSFPMWTCRHNNNNNNGPCIPDLHVCRFFLVFDLFARFCKKTFQSIYMDSCYIIYKLGRPTRRAAVTWPCWLNGVMADQWSLSFLVCWTSEWVVA